MSDQVALRRIARPNVPAYFDDQGFSYLYRLLDADRSDMPTFVHITDRMIKQHPPEALSDFLSQTLGVSRLPSHLGGPMEDA